MTTVLLDANVLIALVVADHVHHDAAERWFEKAAPGFATCPITQGALVRLVIREGGSASVAQELLASFTSRDGHTFWPDDLGFERVTMAGVVGHRQVTDAYLASLARHNGGRVATFDDGFSALHHDVAVRLPTGV